MEGRIIKCVFLRSFFILPLLFSASAWFEGVEAAQLRLTWSDHARNEDGFQIERKTGREGTFTIIAITEANIRAYIDSRVAEGVTYCYQVRAFNTAGVSSYSDEACGTAKATTTNTSAPVFAVNAGGPQYTAPDGTLYRADAVLSGGRTYTITTSIAETKEDPLYQSERYGDFSYAIPVVTGDYAVTLKFAEIYWSASGRRVFDVLAEGKEVIRNLDLFAEVGGKTAYDVTIPVRVTDGTLNLAFRTDVDNAKVSAIKVMPADGGTSTNTTDSSATSTMTMRASTTEADLLNPQGEDLTLLLRGPNIGIFRPTTGAWYLDLNGNGLWDGCDVDGCLGPFGQPGDLPIVGDWTGAGINSIGVITPGTGLWQLDRNDNGLWEGCQVDLCVGPGEPIQSQPLFGDWTGSGTVSIGVFDAQAGIWQLDRNNNGVVEDCQRDLCLGPFGQPGDLPIAADWMGTGATKIGVFDPQTGLWELDLNGDGMWDGCQADGCLGPFGQPGDQPVAGLW